MALHHTYTIDPRSTFLTTLSLFKYLIFTNRYNNYTNVTRYQKLCAISFQLVDHRSDFDPSIYPRINAKFYNSFRDATSWGEEKRNSRIKCDGKL